MEAYYRGLVGSAGRGIHISGGQDIRMRNNVFDMPKTVTFQYSSTSHAW